MNHKHRLFAAIVIGMLIVPTVLSCGLPRLARNEAPSVTISAPASGAALQLGQEIAVQVQATDDRGVVRVELWINGMLERTDTSPDSTGQTPFLVVHGWRPEAPGSYVWSAKAYDAGELAGESEPVVVNVQGMEGAPADQQPTPTPPAPSPTALVPTQTPVPVIPTATVTPLSPTATASEPTPTATSTATMVPDAPPQIQIVAPANPHLMLAGSAVTLRLRATDDAGVSRIELWADGVLVRMDPVGDQAEVDWQMTWNPQSLGSHVLEVKALDTRFQVSPVARLEVQVESAPPPLSLPDPYGVLWDWLGGSEGPLGDPVGEAVQRFYAGQRFEHGFMFWRDNAGATEDWIYAIQWGPEDLQIQGSSWSRFVDLWTEAEPEYSCTEATPPNGPKRGFGKVWCDRAEILAGLGAAVEEEWGANGGWHDFEHGLMLWDAKNGRIFILFDDGTWQAISH
ncbi:MAG: Ig-like domain-containing protein [Anaerolineae bacterium]